MRKNIFIEVPFNESLAKELVIQQTIESSQEFFKEYMCDEYDFFLIYWFDFSRGKSRIIDYKKLWKYAVANENLNLNIGKCSEDIKYEGLEASNYYGVQKIDVKFLEQIFINNESFNSVIICSKSDYLNNPKLLESTLDIYLQGFKSFHGIPENDELINTFLERGDIVIQLRRHDEHPCVHVAMN